jgi:D-amino peptidase
MNVLISVDMEGIAGVVAEDHTTSTHKEYDRFRRLMTAEANAAIEGALAGGATEILVNDSHGGMANILIEDLNPAAELISGRPKPFGMMQGISEDTDVVFFLGYHAAAGTGGATLEHTFTYRVGEIRFNGQALGETGLNAALAGAYGVPVALVTGDKAATEEARTLLGEVETVTVKGGVTRTAARCLHPEVVRQRIREAAERALKRRVSPFIISAPITVRIVFQRTQHADMAELVPGSVRLDGRTLEWTGDDMPTVYRALRAMVALSYGG